MESSTSMDGVWDLVVGLTEDGWCVGSYKQIGTFKLQLSKLLPLLDHSTKHPQIIAPGSSPGPSKNHGWGGVESSTSMDGVGFGGWTD